MAATHDTPIGRFMGRHGLTQQDLANGSGLWVSQINGIVRGHVSPRIDTANKLLAFCRTIEPSVTLDDLFGTEPRSKRTRRIA